MITQETDYKYTLWGETKPPKFKHDREPNPKADWRELAEFTFAPDTKIYEEEDIPRIRWDITVDGRDDVLVMDCLPDCRSVYWYLESQPGWIYYTPRQKYEVDSFTYCKSELAGWEYSMIKDMTDALKIEHPLQTVYLLELWVDKAIGRIDKWLRSQKMGLADIFNVDFPSGNPASGSPGDFRALEAKSRICRNRPT